MTSFRSARSAALSLAAIAAIVLPGSAAAFEPAVLLRDGVAGEHLIAGDVASRAGEVFGTIQDDFGSGPGLLVRWSVDQGATWDGTSVEADHARESAVTICDGDGAVAYARATDEVPDTWSIRISRYRFDGFGLGDHPVAGTGVNRRPDIACIADERLAVAWFSPAESGHTVRLFVRRVSGEDLSPQTLTLGPGVVSKGLAVAATPQRVYVAWFKGSALKLRRYAVGPSPDFTLTVLGTATILTSSSAREPKLAASGERVVLAYQHQADLRVRRSTDRGQSFLGAVTVRNEAFPSEVGVSPTTVAMDGQRVALGALRLAGLETLTGKGFGYLSTNGGATWTQQATHAGGRTLATLVLVDGTQRYAEVWDESIADPDPEQVRYRRK